MFLFLSLMTQSSGKNGADFQTGVIMRQYLGVIWVLPLMFIMSCSTSKIVMDDSLEEEAVEVQKPPPPPAPFVFGAGDEIAITVWRHDDLSRNVMIDPSGNINFPLVGTIHASGMTVPQLQKTIADGLTKYVVDPRVDLNATTLRSQKIYILGEVKNPGSLALDEKMLVWEAIAKTGGFTTDANENNILLVRNEGGEPRVTAVNLNLKELLNDDGVFQNPYLQNGDILYAPPRRIADVERFMIRLNNILSPFVAAERGIILLPEVGDALQWKTGGDIIVPP